MPNDYRYVLVTPHSCVGPASGGGQRTDLFFAALKRLGRTEVVVLGAATGREALEQHFVGHSGLHLIDTQRAFTREVSVWQRMSQRLDRYVRFSRGFRPDPAVRAQMRELLGSEPTVVVYRYFHNYCLAGHEAGDTANIQICVDLDDRDDQKLPTVVRQLTGSGVLASLYSSLLVPRLRKYMVSRLSIASVVWLAADEDLTRLGTLPTMVAPNVPFSSGKTAGDVPPSQCSDVLFVGNCEPNRDGVNWFLRNCWGELHRLHPDSRFRIVGFGNWSELAAESGDIAGVDFVGGVANLAAEYAKSRLVVSPLFSGGGTKIKVIEGCAFGRPVVSTTLSARGFGSRISALLPQSDTADGFVRQCSRFLEDAAAADDLGSHLQAIQREGFSRESVERKIAEQVQSIFAGKQILSAVICTRNRPGPVARIAGLILRGEADDLELIVVDQSDDSETEVALAPLRADPRFRYCRSSKRGKGAALNEGIALSAGTVVVCTDDDCLPPRGWVGGMVRALLSQPNAVICFCKVAPIEHDRTMGYVPAYDVGKNRRLQRIPDICGGLGIGAGMAIRRDFATSMGGFDEFFGPGGRFPSADEWDIAMRALLTQHDVYETADLTIVHDGFRTYAEGEVHARRDWLALGAVCAKPLRAGHWSVLIVAVWLFTTRAAWPPIRDLFHLRRPRGLGRILAFVRGFVGGFSTPVNRKTLRFVDRS